MFARLVKLWIWVSALASLAGWTLSALGMLNKAGYAVFAGVVVAAILFFGKRPLFHSLSLVPELRRWRHRIRRFLPASFAFLAALVFVGGVIYAPGNHTGLSYRLPRVLQWLQHGHWVWIHTPNYRMNDRACGIEWLSAPMLLFLRSDRGLFLLNFIPFVLTPGLIFSVWTRLGVRPRVAWAWMWLVPTGYCFLVQAGGNANDAFPTVYFLAMMDFALRAWERWRPGKGGCSAGLFADSRSSFLAPFCSNLGLSLLSAALLVGAKASNLPLGLPWAILFFPAVVRVLGLKRRCARGSGGVEDGSSSRPALRFWAFDFSRWAFLFLIALVVSFLPTAILNVHYLHDWSGLSIEHKGMDMKNPVAGVLGNGVLLFTENFVPTFFPMAGWWNQHALGHFPGPLVRLMDANFEMSYNTLGEMPIEDACGIGFGISVLLIVSIFAGWKYRNTGHKDFPVREGGWSGLLLRAALIAPWFSLLAYAMKTGMDTPARLIAPYYPLLLPALLIGTGQSQVVQRCWWRILAGGAVALALAALVAEPARPLWPAQTILARLVARHPDNRELSRALAVYRVYATRPDPLAGIRQFFPPGLKVIGFMGTDDDLDISLWKPYGSRRVEPFFVDDSSEKIRSLGVEYAMVGGFNLEEKKTTLAEWLQRSNAELIATTNATMTVIQGPQPWYFVRFKQ